MSAMCICGHDYAAHFNGNIPEDLECFFSYNCDCKKFTEATDFTTAMVQAKQEIA